MRKALQVPARQIVQNAGEDGSVSSARSWRTPSTRSATTLRPASTAILSPQGVIDPTKVVRCALQDAASIAGLLITTEAMVAERPKDAAPAMPGGPAEWVAWAEWVVWAAWTSRPSPIQRFNKGRTDRPALVFWGVAEWSAGTQT